MTFEYDLQQDGILQGRLTNMTYPAGGKITWDYSQNVLGDSEVFDLKYTAQRPSGYSGAEPRLWFGQDYIIIGWYRAPGSSASSQLYLQIIEYGGYWTQEPFNYEVYANAASIDDIYLTFGSDFCALYFHNQGNTSDSLYIFQKNALSVWPVDCQ